VLEVVGRDRALTSHQCHGKPPATAWSEESTVYRSNASRSLTLTLTTTSTIKFRHHARPPCWSSRGAQVPHLTPSAIQKQLQRNPTQHVHITDLLFIKKPPLDITYISVTKSPPRPHIIVSPGCAPTSPGDEGAQQCQEAVRRLQERAEEEQDGLYHLQ
jgi:hypothetical protein